MPVQWTRIRTDVDGSRWAVWEQELQDLIPWSDFKSDVLRYNPNLNRSTEWCFVPGRQYRMPEITLDVALVEPVDGEPVVIADVPYYSQLDNEWTYKYFGSDRDSRDDTPDGCWMACDRPAGPYGKGATGCRGPWEADEASNERKGCIRPGSCNVTALWMVLAYHGLNGALMPDAVPDVAWLKEQAGAPNPSWVYYYMMEMYGEGKQKLSREDDPTSAYNSVVVANPENMQKTVGFLAEAQKKQACADYQTNPISFEDYKQRIDALQPVVINSARMGHVICGTGYQIKNGRVYAIVHDPYGQKDEDVSKWQKYNGCGENDRYGAGIPYLFERLNMRYMLWIDMLSER